MNVGRILLAGAIASLLLCAAIADHSSKKARHAEEIRSAFEFGVRVGETVGGCKTLKSVSDHNPTSDWARSEAVRDALTSCERLPAQPEIVVRGERPLAVREK